MPLLPSAVPRPPEERGVLIAIGVLIVKARPLVERFSGDGRWIQRLPIASAVVIIVVGLGIALNSLGIVD